MLFPLLVAFDREKDYIVPLPQVLLCSFQGYPRAAHMHFSCFFFLNKERRTKAKRSHEVALVLVQEVDARFRENSWSVPRELHGSTLLGLHQKRSTCHKCSQRKRVGEEPA